MSKIYFHLTEETNVISIFQHGLWPYIGSHSTAVGETANIIYLCTEEQLPVWQYQLPLVNPYLLKITVPENFKNKHIAAGHTYGWKEPYQEYLCDVPIPTSYIKAIPLRPIPDNRKPGLVANLLYDVSNLTVKLIRLCDAYETFGRQTDLLSVVDYNQYHINLILSQFQKLADLGAYSLVDQQEMTQSLISLAEEGEYTFCDTYDNQPIQLWEKLDQFPECPLGQERKQLKEKIKMYFNYILNIDTGGYENSYRTASGQINRSQIS